MMKICFGARLCTHVAYLVHGQIEHLQGLVALQAQRDQRQAFGAQVIALCGVVGRSVCACVCVRACVEVGRGRAPRALFSARAIPKTKASVRCCGLSGCFRVVTAWARHTHARTRTAFNPNVTVLHRQDLVREK